MKMPKPSLRVVRGTMPQRGFSMIEVLVTLLIISLALLGTAGLQIYALRLNQGGQFRTQAVFLVADLAERIEANKPGAVAGSYAVATSGTAIAPSAACVVAACIPVDLAGFDLAQWQNTVAATLPQSTWTVAHDGAGNNPITYTITVGWVDRQVDTDKGAFDATGDVTQKLGANAAGTGERFLYTATRTIFNPVVP